MNLFAASHLLSRCKGRVVVSGLGKSEKKFSDEEMLSAGRNILQKEADADISSIKEGKQ